METKITALVCGTVLLLAAGLFVTCNNVERIRSSGPIVETCIKHPATKPPFGPNSGGL